MAATAAPLQAAADDVMIQMVGVHKWYGQFHVLKDIDGLPRVVVAGHQ